jgi:hypothetical protein
MMPSSGDTVYWRRSWGDSWELSLVVAHGTMPGDPPVTFFRVSNGSQTSRDLTISDHGTRWLREDEPPQECRCEKVGLRPMQEDRRAFDIYHCEHCFAPVVWAWDDMFPDDDSPLMKRTCNLEPVPAQKGHVILYYAIDADGLPVGRQMFRRWEPGENYTGDTWELHASTCPHHNGTARARGKR